MLVLGQGRRRRWGFRGSLGVLKPIEGRSPGLIRKREGMGTRQPAQAQHSKQSLPPTNSKPPRLTHQKPSPSSLQNSPSPPVSPVALNSPTSSPSSQPIFTPYPPSLRTSPLPPASPFFSSPSSAKLAPAHPTPTPGPSSSAKRESSSCCVHS